MTDLKQPKQLNEKVNYILGGLGRLIMDSLHNLALFAIGAAIMWSAITAFVEILTDMHITIADILLLFIYLELLAMVGIYFKTNHMPVRFLIYVAITALTRMMIGDIQAHHQTPDLGIIYISSAILILALATLVIRFGSAKYPYSEISDDEAIQNPTNQGRP